MAAALVPPLAEGGRTWRQRRRSWRHGGSLQALAPLLAGLPLAAVPGLGISLEDLPPASCGPRFMSPGAPELATALNGVALPDVCIVHGGEFHVFVIGDWGGVIPMEGPPAWWQEAPRPADHRDARFGAGFSRTFVKGVDDRAQQRVAAAMEARAETQPPDFVLNVGDSFYWGGIAAQCGAPAYQHLPTTQWRRVFEEIYSGERLRGKQWLGVLGNHDYGGYKFTNGWDQVIGYTWAGGLDYSQDRWVIPAQYWKVRVWYPDFSVDFYFVDSNVFTTWEPEVFEEDNICGRRHNAQNAQCGEQGPDSVDACPTWFGNLWRDQARWLERHLGESRSDWQVVVTHVPPDAGGGHGWANLVETYGVDLLVTGHRHRQELWGPEDSNNELAPTVVVVSGGGGGITSTGVPDADGDDDEYGFMSLTLTRDAIRVEAISHGGRLRRSVIVPPRSAIPRPAAAGTAPSAFEAVGSGAAAPDEVDHRFFQ